MQIRVDHQKAVSENADEEIDNCHWIFIKSFTAVKAYALAPVEYSIPKVETNKLN